MALTTSTMTPLMVRNSRNYNQRDHIMVMNRNEPITYQQPKVIHRSYQKLPKSHYHYTVEQDGKSYRCCQWCRYCCTRTCPFCDFCDRIYACPLLCLILSGLFLLFLFIALLTLFGLHPNINSARHYYGIISTLSILNTSTYIYNLDQLCGSQSIFSNCLNIITSTRISQVSTTITINRTIPTMNCSYVLLIFCLSIYCIYQKVRFYTL